MAKSGSTRSRGRCIRPTPASTRSSRLGVVIPKSREDLCASSRPAGVTACSITMRGGGTSQAGQAIGAGVVVDTSKYLNRLLEVNAAERWARVEPGIVLDELNAALAPHRLRFAPDISTASRATIGGMIANNSSGARSVIYGKTIDHVLRLEVAARRTGRSRGFRPLDAAELDAAVQRDDARSRVLSRGPAACRASMRERDRAPLSEGPAPRRRLQPGRVRGTTGRRRSALQSREAHRRLGRHARHRRRGQNRPRPAAGSQGGARDPVRGSARRARGDAGDPPAPPFGRRGDGRVHPRSHEAERRSASAPADVRRRGAGRAALRRVLRRSRRRSAAAARGDRAGSRRARIRLSFRRATDPAAQRRSGRSAKPRSACLWR